MDSFENRSSTESKYIDYLYEDNVDYSSNVDYTVGPDFFTKAATADTPVNPLHQLLAYSHYFLFYDGSHFLGFVSQGLLILFLWTTAYFVLNLDLPGNPNGKLWPIYIPEHYGERNSQHLLDPYSFVHFGHGLLSYYAFGTLDGDEPPIQYVKNRYNLKEYQTAQTALTYRKETKGMGMLLTIILAFIFEMFENSQLTIQLFRQNSGTSEFYIGDSSINVIGDLMSCTLGYNVAKFFTLNGYPKVPLILYVLSEFILAMTIRDNLMLIIWQLIYPSDWIRNWQAELIPLKMDFKSEENDEIEEQGYWLNKYTLPKTSLKYRGKGEKKKESTKKNEYWKKEQGYWKNKFNPNRRGPRNLFETLFEN